MSTDNDPKLGVCWGRSYRSLPLEHVDCPHCTGNVGKIGSCTFCGGRGQVVRYTEIFGLDNPNIPLLENDGERVRCDFCDGEVCVDFRQGDDGRIACGYCWRVKRVLRAGGSS
jgi:hypothetical protein